MKIKVCGMVEASNIRDLIQLDINYVGFIFYPKSKRYLPNSLSKEMFNTIPSNVKKVGVFVNQSLEFICEKNETIQFDLIQLHGDESVAYCENLKYKVPAQLIKAIQITHNFDFNSIAPYLQIVDYFLFDTASKNYGGTGISFDWQILRNYEFDKPFILSGGINQEDSKKLKALNHPQFHAIDLNSKFEIAPGIKDVPKIERFITKIKTYEN